MRHHRAIREEKQSEYTPLSKLSNTPAPEPIRRFTPDPDQRRFFASVLLAVLAALLILTIGAIEIAQRAARDQIVQGITSADRQAVNAMVRDARETLVDVTADLLAFRNILARRLAEGEVYDNLQSVFFDFMGSHRVYDQLRFLDMAGMERVRVDNESQGPVGLAAELLQDKSRTGYFTRAANLSPNEILITQLEPNRENGELEIPINPVIRMLTPVLVGGEQVGYAVLNYRAKSLLENTMSIGNAALGRPLIVSGQGFEAQQILNVESAQGLMEMAATASFSDRLPVAWNRISEQSRGVVDDGYGGIVVFNRLFPGLLDTPEELGDGVSWTLPMNTEAAAEGGFYMMLHVDAELLGNITGLALGPYSTVVVLFLLAAAAVAWLVALRLASVRENAKRLHSLATRDALTGLLNRGEFLFRAGQAMALAQRHDRALGVLYIDMDGFKLVNDSLGHAVGDELLQFVAKRLTEAIRETDPLGRIGGDEFAVVLTDIRGKEDAKTVAGKLRRALSTEAPIGGNYHAVRSSVGFAAYPEDGPTVDALLEKADQSMYLDKTRGRRGRGPSTTSDEPPRRSTESQEAETA